MINNIDNVRQDFVDDIQSYQSRVDRSEFLQWQKADILTPAGKKFLVEIVGSASTEIDEYDIRNDNRDLEFDELELLIENTELQVTLAGQTLDQLMSVNAIHLTKDELINIDNSECDFVPFVILSARTYDAFFNQLWASGALNFNQGEYDDLVKKHSLDILASALTEAAISGHPHIIYSMIQKGFITFRQHVFHTALSEILGKNADVGCSIIEKLLIRGEPIEGFIKGVSTMQSDNGVAFANLVRVYGVHHRLTAELIQYVTRSAIMSKIQSILYLQCTQLPSELLAMILGHMEGMRKDLGQKYLERSVEKTRYLKAVKVISAGVVQQLYNHIPYEIYSKAVGNRSMLYKRLCQYLSRFLGEGDRTTVVATLREGIFESTFERCLHTISNTVSRIQSVFIRSMGSLEQERLEEMLWPEGEIKPFAQSDYLMLADEKVAFPEAKKRDQNPEIAIFVGRWAASRREMRRCVISDKVDLVENIMR